MATVEQQPHTKARGKADGGRATSTDNTSQRSTIPVENPATGEIIAEVPKVEAAAIEGMVARARAAQPAWQALDYEGRGRVMHAARVWLMQNRDRMRRTIVEETGKTPEDAQLAEVFMVADSLSFWAKKAPKYLADERVRSHSPFVFGKKLFVRYGPIGVVGVIGPWNYPLLNCFGDSVAALMAGNAVILKPSEVTPLSTLLMAEGMKAAGLPEGVLQVAAGEGDAGAALVEQADMIMFTGSTRTGKKIMAKASETLTPVSLELGGKDPMIVLADADLERAANAAVYWAMSNGGQMCTSVERVYVEDPAYDQFVAKVVDKARALRQGVPGEPGAVDVGAVTFPPQIELIEDHVRDALDKGAQVVVGGNRREGSGRFFEPTVLTGVDHTMKIMVDETFGPTLPIMRVRDAEEALRLANDSRYGLNSSVWTKDAAKGERLATRVEAGSTCVNDCVVNYGATEMPMGGIKESGIGVRHSAKGIQKYCTSHSVLVTRLAQKRELYYFPYSKRSTKLFERLMVLIHGRAKR